MSQKSVDMIERLAPRKTPSRPPLRTVPSPIGDLPVFHVSVAARTDVGLIRSHNEDAFVVADLTGGDLLREGPVARYDVGERGVLLAVADGMGGAKAGEVASSLAVETLRRSLDRAVANEAPRPELVTGAIESAHRVVWNESQRAGQSGSSRMGATLTVAYVHGGVAYIAEVGDSRAYLIRANEITQLTKDQSLVQQLIDTGSITHEEANHSPFRNVILQAMGHQEDLGVSLARLELRDRDCLLLCSDGLTNMVKDEEIRDIVLRGRDLDAAAQRLVEFANERGGTDNVTVVLAGIGGFLAPSVPGEKVQETIEVLKEYEPTTKRRPSRH